MDKRIFSITCTTCQARLVVRSESAIGAILECPRCQSMVQVLPPQGWKPTPPPQTLLPTAGQTGIPALSAGPPPLDRVAAVPLTLELEPPETWSLGMLLGQKWFLWSGASLATLAVVWLLFFLFSGAEPEPAAVETENHETVNQRPAMAAAETAAKKPPGPQSGGIQGREKERPVTAVAENVPLKPTPVQPLPPPSTQPPRSADAKPAEPDPFPLAADEAAENSQQAEIKKVPPAQVDVAARLADPVAQLELTDMPLAKAVDLLAAIGALPITMDADALMQLGITPHDPVSLRLGSTTLGKALQAAVAEKGLAAAVENGQVVVTTPAEYRETLRKVRYTVDDLTGDDKTAADELAALVRKLVAPESWQGAGGRGTIESERGAMSVVQTGNVHQQVLVFCEKLRNARHKSLRSRDNPERFTLATRSGQARKMLEQPVTVNFHESASLVKVLAFLAEAAKGDILIDRAALAAAETSDRVEATLTAKKQPLGAALSELLRPLGLTYRAIGANAIQVTTKEMAEERLELEFYPVGPWLAKQDPPLPQAGVGQGVRGSSLADRLKARVAASTWSDVGGPGEVFFDPPSQCLIVLQSQPAQAAIERLLAANAEGGRPTD